MLRRENRLKKNKEFNYIYKKGKTIDSSNFLIFYVNTYFKFSKVGFGISKKLGNSVMRSKAKRIMSEVVRHNLDKIVVRNYVIVIKPSIFNTTYQKLEEEFLQTFQKNNMLR